MKLLVQKAPLANKLRQRLKIVFFCVLEMMFLVPFTQTMIAQTTNKQKSGYYYSTSSSDLSKERIPIDQIRKILLDGTFHPEHVLLALHRAAWIGGIPENSTESVREALKNPNVEIIELDIKTSKDGVVYLMHDDYLQRTTNFLDVYPGVYGTGKDDYGKASKYTWEEISKLKLKNEERIYTEYKVPLLKDVIELVAGKAIIQLDINDDVTFQACINLVKERDAFKFVMFKGNKTVKQFLPFIKELSEEQKKQVIFAPYLRADSKPDTGSGQSNDLPGFYTQWEEWCNANREYVGIAGIYEMVFRTPNDVPVIELGEKIRSANKKRLGIFSAQPEYYLGRYQGNVNIGQCCGNTPENDRRGDWDFILAPNGSKLRPFINGYILTDEVNTFLEFFPSRGGN